MKEKQDLKKQLIILSIVLVFVIILAIVMNINGRENESNTKIKDSTVNQNTTQQPSVEEFMDKLKGLVEDTTPNTNNQNVTNEENSINYEESEIIELDTGEIVLYNEQNHEE